MCTWMSVIVRAFILNDGVNGPETCSMATAFADASMGQRGLLRAQKIMTRYRIILDTITQEN